MEEKTNRPTSVVLIGWLCIGFSCLTMLSGIFGYVIWKGFLMKLPPPPISKGTDIIESLDVIFVVIFNYFDLFSIAQILVSIFMLITGIQFLRLCQWARVVIEAAMWFILLCMLAYWIFSLLFLIKITSGLPVIEMLMITIAIAILTIPVIVVIKNLRGATIKEAFKQG